MLADLLGGEQVQAAFDNLHASVGHIRAGRLRALAVTTVIRSEALPHVPSLSELSSGYEASAFFGITAPKATPIAVVNKLNEDVNASLVDSKGDPTPGGIGAPLVLSPNSIWKADHPETLTSRYRDRPS